MTSMLLPLPTTTWFGKIKKKIFPNHKKVLDIPTDL